MYDRYSKEGCMEGVATEDNHRSDTTEEGNPQNIIAKSARRRGVDTVGPTKWRAGEKNADIMYCSFAMI